MSAQFDINKFQADKNYVIEASAGTGKTYSIVQIVEKLISKGISLDKMLIVTYTEKAAGELRNRIREKVKSVGEDVDGASICTIHSFCQNIIAEFNISAGKASNLQLIDENEADGFVRAYIREGQIYDDICLIKKYFLANVNTEKLETKIVGNLLAIIQKYYLNDSFNEDKTIVSLKDSIGILGTGVNAIKLLEEYCINGKSALDLFPEAEHARLVLESGPTRKMNEMAVALLGSKDLSFNTRKYDKNTPQTDAEKEAYECIKYYRDELRSAFNATSLCRALALKYGKDIYVKWLKEKEKYRRQTFNDMIRVVREEVVNERPLLTKIREKYAYAIIDEFQDTNRKQWDIFKKVFLSEGHNITVVLDPKQSIYSFQGADLKVSQKATDEILKNGGIARSLTINYRATTDIVESTNALFNIPGAIDSFTLSSGSTKLFDVSYDKKKTPAFWVCDEYAKEDNEVSGDNRTNEEIYSDVVCQTIVDCCSYNGSDETKLRITDENGKVRNVSFSDFAILAKSRPEMEAIVRALEKSGIPYVKYKDNGLFVSRECAHWITILEAVNTPDFTGRNRIQFRRALYTVFFKKSLKEIKDSRYDKDNIHEAVLFDKWRELAKDEKWEELIEAIIEDTELEKKLNSLRDIKSLGIMRQIGNYAVNYLSNNGSLTMLVRNLKKRINDGDDDEADDGDGIIARSTDFECVKLMTIHASKGLEFPIVISAAGSKGYNKAGNLFGYHESSGEYVLSFERNTERCDRELIEEFKRLIYVAYTRAKYILILPRHFKRNEQMEFVMDTINTYCSKSTYRSLTDNGRKYCNLKSEVKIILDKNRKSSGNKTAQKEELKKLIGKCYGLVAYKRAYSSMSHSKPKDTMIDDTSIMVTNGEDTEANSEAGLEKYDSHAKQIICNYSVSNESCVLSKDYPAGAGIGTALHDVLELVDYKKDIKSPEGESLIKECFKKQGIKRKSQWIQESQEMLMNVLSANLPEINGNGATGNEFRLRDIEFSERKNEIEFNFNKEGEKLRNFFNGFIDLIVKRGEFYSILDWKSDRLNDNFTSYCDGPILKEHVDKLYSIQRVLYSYTLIKWLKMYYPGCSEQEVFEKHFGGIYYVFLRGCNEGTCNGIYAQTWENFDALKAAYDEIVKDKA